MFNMECPFEYFQILFMVTLFHLNDVPSVCLESQSITFITLCQVRLILPVQSIYLHLLSSHKYINR